MNAVLVRPLPYDSPETRVMIWSRWTGFDKTWVSEHEVFDYRELWVPLYLLERVEDRLVCSACAAAGTAGG